jgi:hypothetical protein
MRQFRRLMLWVERVESVTTTLRPIKTYLRQITAGVSKKLTTIKAEDENLNGPVIGFYATGY